jgi:hypothetical protein
MTELEERNFCPRCGKRLASGFVEISIHTCTPKEIEYAKAIEAKLKEKNT